MMECDICGDYFHPDEISNCPKCDIEICESCFENHVRCCGEDTDMDDENDEISNLPRDCPDCGDKLELDTDPNSDKNTLLCNQCGYQLDVTAEFKKIDDNDD